MTKAAGIRARNRAALETEIQAVASRHLAEYGAAALSLRAIAREMGMASSAIYRYVESRDELLTRLIVAAYDSVGDAAEAAAGSTALPPLERFRAVARAFRGWALSHPHQFALLYGSPVPGYHAPPERTGAAGTRIPRLLVEMLRRLEDHPVGSDREQRALGPMLGDPMFAGTGITAGTLHRGLAAWTLVLGTVTAELFEQYGADAFAEPDAFFEAILDDSERLITG